MPQSPIAAQAYARGPNKNFLPLLCNPQGLLYTVPGAGFGNSYFVDEASGNDSTGDGTPGRPLATLAAAYDEIVANSGDSVYCFGTVHVTATVPWTKNGTNLVMLNAVSENDRGRISQSGSTVFSPLVNVTAQGCNFVDISTFHGFDDASAQICWSDTGGRNHYSGVDFLGMGNATAAAQAGSRSLVIGGSGENVLDDCVIGLDTILRATAANASLECIGGTPRNVFNRAIFRMLTSLATDVHVKVGAAGIDRELLFNDPCFLNAIESTSIAINQAISADNAAGGAVCLNRPFSLGATAYATAGPVYIVGSTPAATTSGIAIKAT